MKGNLEKGRIYQMYTQYGEIELKFIDEVGKALKFQLVGEENPIVYLPISSVQAQDGWLTSLDWFWAKAENYIKLKAARGNKKKVHKSDLRSA